MGVPKRSVSVPEQETHFDCLPLRDHKPPQQTKWLRVQDQRRPRRAAPTSSPSSPRGRSRSSRRLSVSWTQTRTVSCPPVTLLPPLIRRHGFDCSHREKKINNQQQDAAAKTPSMSLFLF